MIVAKDGLSKSKVYPCGVCSLRVMVNIFYVYNVLNQFTVDALG